MLALTLTPQPLDSGTIEEQATFGTLAVRANGRCLTEGVAPDANELLPGPRVSGYQLAEWLAWNRWRLLWEARPSEHSGHEWAFSHSLSSIGGGYVWPNIEISSDGVRAIVTSAPTVDRTPGLYRYVGAPTFEIISATELEVAIGEFVRSMLALLERAKVANTNLHRIWRDLGRQHQDADATRLRRLEARLGRDPDEIAASQLRPIMDEAGVLGIDSVEELAADAGVRRTTDVLSAQELIDTAHTVGWDVRPQDAAELRANDHTPAFGEVAAWRLGVGAAHALRRQEALDGEPIDNTQLSALAGTQATALAGGDMRPSPLSFVLTARGHTRVVLRGKRETGRRFDLARLLGDRLLGQNGPLLPATQANTYRQKAQRAFAAEFLCPYDAVCEFLGQDRSEERCDEAARHFNVSPLAISSLLLNNHGLDTAVSVAPLALPPACTLINCA